MASRKDVYTYVIPATGTTTTSENNYTSFLYPTDMGSSFNLDMNFSTKVLKGQLESVFAYKKDFIDDQTAPMIYLTKLEDSDLVTKKITENTYDEVRRIPNPIATTLYYKSASAESARILTSTQYDVYGNVLSSTDPYNKTTTYQYDPVTRLRTSEKWPTGNNAFLYVSMQRNAQGDVTSYELKNSASAPDYLSKSTYTYDGFGNILTTKDYDTNKEVLTTYEYDTAYGSAYLTKVTEAYKDVDGVAKSSFKTATYAMLTGNMLSLTDPRGYTTSYIHDKLDRITKITNPDLTTFQVDYNDIANQLTTTNETGIKTRTTWDPLGRASDFSVFENGLFKSKTKTGYDNLSRKIWEEDPSGNRVAYTYDAWDRVTKTTNPDASFSTTTFDDINNVVTDADEENSLAQRTYDKLGRVTVEKERDNGVFVTKQTTAYDDAGNVTQQQNALNAITTFSYDLLGHLTGVVTAKNELYQYGYDRLGNQTTVLYPGGGQISKQYDEIGRLIRFTDEAGQIKKLYYDASGNLAQLIDRKNQTINYAYDGKNRLLSRSSSGSSVSYTYFSDGKRKTMTDQTGVTEYNYDIYSGLLTQKKYPDGKVINYTYDLRANRTQVIDPFGRTTNYVYDNVNRIENVTTNGQLSGQYEYYKNDKFKKIELGNGISTNYTYEDFDLKTVTHKKADGTALNSYSYGYDTNDNVIVRTENGQTYNYTYDALGRVQTNSQFSETYGYDARGNRSSLVSDDMPEIEPSTYTYDDWNRLTSVTNSNNETVTYVYNGDDQLYERTENGSTTRYYWDDDRIIAEATVNGTQVTPKASYIYGYGLLERIDAMNLSRASYLMNGHQDVVELRGSDGSLLNQYTYDIWGKPLTITETVSNPFRYSSEYWDGKSELQYLRARWYNPQYGRFINEDTYEGDIKNPLSLNLYTYVENSPLIKVDPTGHWSLKGAFKAVANVAKVAYDVTIGDDIRTLTS